MPEWDSEVKTNGTKLARIIRGPPLPGEFSWSIQTKDAWTERDDDFIKMYTVRQKYISTNVSAKKN